MIKDIENGIVNCVIVKDLSRFGRDYIETGRYLERYFPNNDIRFISVNDNIDSFESNYCYDLIMPIKNIFNEQYARDISSKVQSAFKVKQKNGEFVGAFASYGYLKSPTDKHKLIIDTYAAEVVKRIFKLYIEGYGKVRIAKILNQEGVLCPTEYKKSLGMKYINANRHNGTYYWTYATISKILSNEIYCGKMIQGKTKRKMKSIPKKVEKDEWIVVDNTHEAIIDEDTWNKVQKLIKTNYKDMQFNMDINLFSGIIKCGDCKRAMTRTKWGKEDTVYYTCSSYRNYGVKICSSHLIHQNDLEMIILDDLNNIIKDFNEIEDLINIEHSHNKNLNNINEIEQINQLLEKNNRLKDEIYLDYKEGLLDKNQYIKFKDEYLVKEKNYLQMIDEIMKKRKGGSNTWVNELLTNKSIKNLDRSIILDMIKDIYIYENNKIKIVYNFENNSQE